MADKSLQEAIEGCRRDYEAVRGQPFEHFFCPILHVDEPTNLCRGHVVGKAFRSSNLWVPQRADVDNFYGSIAEADFLHVIQDRSKSAVEVWLDPRSRKRHGPHLEYNGKKIEFYFIGDTSQVPLGQRVASVIGPEGNTISDFAIKATAEELLSLDGKQIDVVVGRDYRPPVVASLIKAAHLTLFRKLGYAHVFSPTGVFLADILARFFQEQRRSNRDRQTAVAEYFQKHSNMVYPLIVRGGTPFQGTVVDNFVLSLVGSSEGIFAVGVIVTAGNDSFCIFCPTYDHIAVGTYFSFLNEPPRSVAAKVTRFKPADGKEESYWQVDSRDPIRIQLPFGGFETE